MPSLYCSHCVHLSWGGLEYSRLYVLYVDTKHCYMPGTFFSLHPLASTTAYYFGHSDRPTSTFHPHTSHHISKGQSIFWYSFPCKRLFPYTNLETPHRTPHCFSPHKYSQIKSRESYFALVSYRYIQTTSTLQPETKRRRKIFTMRMRSNAI